MDTLVAMEEEALTEDTIWGAIMVVLVRVMEDMVELAAVEVVAMPVAMMLGLAVVTVVVQELEVLSMEVEEDMAVQLAVGTILMVGSGQFERQDCVDLRG